MINKQHCLVPYTNFSPRKAYLGHVKASSHWAATVMRLVTDGNIVIYNDSHETDVQIRAMPKYGNIPKYGK